LKLEDDWKYKGTDHFSSPENPSTVSVPLFSESSVEKNAEDTKNDIMDQDNGSSTCVAMEVDNVLEHDPKDQGDTFAGRNGFVKMEEELSPSSPSSPLRDSMDIENLIVPESLNNHVVDTIEQRRSEEDPSGLSCDTHMENVIDQDVQGDEKVNTTTTGGGATKHIKDLNMPDKDDEN
jgi:hypothetical protein